MPAVKLTARFCEGAKPTKGKQLSYPDAVVTGLEFRISGSGRKSWSFRYRTHDSRQGRLTLGVFSDSYDLEKARREAAKVRVVVDDGGDPAEVKRATKHKAKTEPIRTMDDLAETYFAACERGEWRPKNKHKRASTLKNEREVYRLYLKGPLGRTRPEAVTRPRVKDILRAMIDRGISSRTNRAHAILRQMFNFAVAEGRVAANPVIMLPPMAPQKPRARTYTDSELAAVWDGILHPEKLKMPANLAAKRRDGEKVHVGPAVRIALQLAMLLLNRRGEIAGMEIPELDLENRVWLIPAERMKNNLPHAVPLSEEAVKLIRQALDLHAGRQTPYVFPSPTGDKPIGGAAMYHALKGVLSALGIAKATLHDIRRTGSTALTSERLGVTPFIRSKVLSHSDAGGGAEVSSKVYDVNSYISEKRRALQAWEALLLEIVGERVRPSNVEPMHKGAV